MVLVDSEVFWAHSSKIKNYFLHHNIAAKIIPIDVQEETKDLETLLFILKTIENFAILRRSEPLICIGGGVLLDIGGLAASLYRRGIPYIKVPTTLLAQQHYESFKDRFADTPVQVELLSRFRTTQEQNKALAAMESGSADIIIGTHKLIQKDIKFKDLGLLIIDEEHRFGVQQKERLKSLRSEVDILNLTATPIPRTLNMAMGGIRNITNKKEKQRRKARSNIIIPNSAQQIFVKGEYAGYYEIGGVKMYFDSVKFKFGRSNQDGIANVKCYKASTVSMSNEDALLRDAKGNYVMSGTANYLNNTMSLVKEYRPRTENLGNMITIALEWDESNEHFIVHRLR